MGGAKQFEASYLPPLILGAVWLQCGRPSSELQARCPVAAAEPWPTHGALSTARSSRGGLPQLTRGSGPGVQVRGVLLRRAASAPGGLRVSRSRQWWWWGGKRQRSGTLPLAFPSDLRRFCLPFYGPQGGLAMVQTARVMRSRQNDEALLEVSRFRAGVMKKHF